MVHMRLVLRDSVKKNTAPNLIKFAFIVGGIPNLLPKYIYSIYMFCILRPVTVNVRRLKCMVRIEFSGVLNSECIKYTLLRACDSSSRCGLRFFARMFVARCGNFSEKLRQTSVVSGEKKKLPSTHAKSTDVSPSVFFWQQRTSGVSGTVKPAKHQVKRAH